MSFVEHIKPETKTSCRYNDPFISLVLEVNSPSYTSIIYLNSFTLLKSVIVICDGYGLVNTIECVRDNGQHAVRISVK